MSDALRKHARRHHGVGLDPLDLASIAGILTDAQHASKTGIPDAHHREWGWANEWGWRLCLHIPYAYNLGWVYQTQVLSPGATGEWDDDRIVHPHVLYLPDVLPTTPFLLYYSGKRVDTNFSIGLALGSDEQTFTKIAENPIVSGLTGYSHICFPKVIYDVHETDPAKRYKMICSAYNTTAAAYRFILLHGSDYKTFSFVKELTTPYNAYDTLSCPNSIVQTEQIWLHSYLDKVGDLRLCVWNRDFSKLTNIGVILSGGGAGAWDEEITDIFLFFNLGVFYGYYVGRQIVDTARLCRIGVATTTAPLITTEWFKWPLNPVLEKFIQATGWRGQASPSLQMIDHEFMCWTQNVGSPFGFHLFKLY